MTELNKIPRTTDLGVAVTAELKTAVRIEAARQGVSMSKLVSKILADMFKVDEGGSNGDGRDGDERVPETA